MGDKVREIAIKFREREKSCRIIPCDDSALAKFLKRQNASSYAIVCDSTTKRLFGEKLKKKLLAEKLKAGLFSFPAGEKSKNLATVEKLMDEMLSKGIDRKSMVIALGGGVAGDVAGFVASCYMRGIPYVQVPTTLLAMVDSSIGGKTGVDLKNGKNSCGAFYQPKAVFMNVSYLEKLPEKEIRNGLAECIKYGIISDKELFYYLEENLDRIFAKDKRVLGNIVSECARIKSEVVINDEKEQNLRKILNFGHTIGHAVEALTNYKKYSHGEAIACGMHYELLLAEKICNFPHEEAEKARALLERSGFEVDLPELKSKKLIEFMKKDKKNVSGKINFALPKMIGLMYRENGLYSISVNLESIKKALSQ